MSPRRGPAATLLALALGILLAAAGLLASSVRVWLEVEEGVLHARALGARVAVGVDGGGEAITARLEAPQVHRRSSSVLLPGSHPAGRLLHLARRALPGAGTAAAVRLDTRSLARAPAAIWIWNPFRDTIHLARGDGSPIATFSLDVPERSLSTESASASFDAPHLRLIAAGLAYSLGAALVLVAGIRLLAAAPWRGRPSAPGTSSGGHLSAASPRTATAERRPSAPARGERLAVFAAGAVWIGFVHLAVLEAAPGFGDEMNYLVQARLLESGHLSLPEPRFPELFRVDWMHLQSGDGKLWNFHPIGNSILLAIGLVAGSASWVPPLVGGAILATLFAIARALVEERWFAWLCVLVAASSQYFVSLAASFMSHAPALLFLLLAVRSLVAFESDRRERHVIASAAWLGVAFLMRPLPVALTAPLVVAWLLPALRRREVRARALAAALLVFAAIASIEALRTWEASGRFTLGYLAKGPEVDTALDERWARGWDWRIQNLYVNYRYYHDRVFGLGFAGNLVPFFVPLLVFRRRWVVAGYLSLLVFWVGHSFLHFYGWGWEPRMLFEASHVVFLLTALGLWRLLRSAGVIHAPDAPAAGPSRLAAGAALALTGGFLLAGFAYDLPDRLRNEYRGYNNTGSAIVLRDAIRRHGIHDAVVLHPDVTAGFAPMLPDNEIDTDRDGRAFFSGDVVHAIAASPSKIQAFLASHPARRVFRWQYPELREEANFYRETLPLLGAELRAAAASDGEPPALGLPWLALLDEQDRQAFEGARLFDDTSFAELFLAAGAHPPRSAALVGELGAYAAVLAEAFPGAGVRALDLPHPVTLVTLDPATRRATGTTPGLLRRVFANPLCEGEPASAGVVGLVGFDASGSTDLCVEWRARFELAEAGRWELATVSADGSLVAIDGEILFDNGFGRLQPATRLGAVRWLERGAHTLLVRYSQLAGDAWFEALAGPAGAPLEPLDLSSFGSPMRGPDEASTARDEAASTGGPLRASSAALQNDAVVDPVLEIVDRGAEPGSLRLAAFEPYELARHPLLSFQHRLAPATAYSVRVRLRRAPDVWYEITMRPEHPIGEGAIRIGSFDARQDGRWHRVSIDLGAAIGRPGDVVEEVAFGEWSGVDTVRSFHLAGIQVGPHAGALLPRGGDNEVAVVTTVPAGSSALRRARPGPAAAVDLAGAALSSSRADPAAEQSVADGSLATRWDTGAAQRGGEWLAVDLGRLAAIAAVHVDSGTSTNDFPRRLHVLLSSDGASFEPVAIVEGDRPRLEIALEPPVWARHVRLEQRGSHPHWFWSVSELEILEAPQDAAPGDGTARLGAAGAGATPSSAAGVEGARAAAPSPSAPPFTTALLAAGCLGAALAAAAVADRRSRRRRVGPAATAAPRAIGWTALALGAAAAIILLAMQGDYGETWDEWEHFENGEAHYRFLAGGGSLDGVFQHAFRKYYAPFSDTVSAALAALLSDRLGLLEVARARHLHLHLLYVASALVLLAAVAREHGRRAGLLAFLAYLLFPRLLGHSHNNMKDFPVTAWMVMATGAFYLGLDRRRHLYLAAAGLLTGAAVATKINGVLLPPLLAAFAAAHLRWARSSAGDRLDAAAFLARGGVLYAAAAAAAAVLLWPWLWEAPWARLVESMSFFRNHIWDGLVLYDGDLVRASQIPARYPFHLLLLTTPTAWLPFLAVGLARVVPELRRGRTLSVLLALGLALGAGAQVVSGAPMYDGIRHFLPAVPFLTTLAALGMDAAIAWAATRPGRRVLAGAAVGAALGAAAFQCWRLHPYQTTYYNALVGGTAGADGRFELDYWGNSLREAGRWVNRHAPPEARVHVLLGLERLAELRPDLVPAQEDADYAIVLRRESLARDPYQDLEPAYVVRAGGAVLARVYAFEPSPGAAP
ncbi:MAG TPA: glycosyltransferase family 39 protein [Thermoanaerobaculia bacterium]|nr:glycosyltransferase family 39 protein [Thermoanaerobaculia bacterium]